MPNHCYNELTADKEILEEIYNYDKKEIDFNKLIPMPEELRNSVADGSTRIKKALYLYLNGDKDLLLEKWENNIDLKHKFKTLNNLVSQMLIKYPKEELKRSYECLQKYGTDNWYDWSIKNWGTKWNAYDFQGSPEEGVLIFLTAWDPPREIVKALCQKYPNSNLDWYYDEEGCQNAGHYYSGENGEVINEVCPSRENEDDMEF